MYAARVWPVYLATVKCLDDPSADFLLGSLWRFFTGSGCQRWIRYGLIGRGVVHQRHLRYLFDRSTTLNDVLEYLARWNKTSRPPILIDSTDRTTDQDYQWMKDILDTPQLLHKRMTEHSVLLLYDSQNFNEIQISALLLFTISHYCNAVGQQVKNMEDLEKLSEDDFGWIPKCVGRSNPINNECLIVGYALCRLWTAVIQCASKGEISWRCNHSLAEAYLQTDNKDKAVEVLELLSAPDSICHRLEHQRALAVVYRNQGEIVKAINTLKLSTKASSIRSLRLLEAYFALGDFKEVGLHFAETIPIVGVAPGPVIHYNQWWESQCIAQGFMCEQNTIKALHIYDQAAAQTGWMSQWAATAKKNLLSNLPKFVESAGKISNLIRFLTVLEEPRCALVHDGVLKNSSDSLRMAQSMFKRGNDWIAMYNIHHPTPDISFDLDYLYTFEHATRVTCIRLSRDGRILATGCIRAAHLYDLNNGSRIATFFDDVNPTAQYVVSICFSPDEKYLAAGFTSDKYVLGPDIMGFVMLWKIEAGGSERVKLETKSPMSVNDVLFSGDGNILYAASGDGTITIFDVGLGDSLRTITPPAIAVTKNVSSLLRHLSISADTKWVTIGASEGNIFVWELESGEVITGPPGGSGSIYSVSFSPNGRQIAWGNSDGLVVICDLEVLDDEVRITKSIEFQLRHDIYCIGWSPDGKVLVMGDQEGNVHIWGADGQPLCILNWVPGYCGKASTNLSSLTRVSVNSIDIAANGVFATGSFDCTAKVWRYRDHKAE